MIRRQIALFLTCGLLAGCGQVAVFGHTIGERSPVSPMNADPAATSRGAVGRPSAARHVVKTVTVALTPQAAARIANDPRFDVRALLEAVNGELRARQLLADTQSNGTQSNGSGTAEISIDDFAMRPTSNAVVFGFVISAGTLNGAVRVRDVDGKDLQSFQVEAAAQVSVAAKGENVNPLAPLYRRFAVLTADRLSGTASKSAPGADQHYRSGL